MTRGVVAKWVMKGYDIEDSHRKLRAVGTKLLRR